MLLTQPCLGTSAIRHMTNDYVLVVVDVLVGGIPCYAGVYHAVWEAYTHCMYCGHCAQLAVAFKCHFVLVCHVDM